MKASSGLEDGESCPDCPTTCLLALRCTNHKTSSFLMESSECTDVDTPSSSGGNTEDIHAGNVTLDAHIDVRVTREEKQRHKAACATRWTVVTMRSRH